MDASASRVVSFARVVMSSVALLIPVSALPTTNAAGVGDWISVGILTNLYVGTAGHFYMIGNDMGSCASTTPTYIRANMTQDHWKELYALLLYSHSQQKTVMCVVDSGCGSSEVWISYCRVPLE